MAKCIDHRGIEYDSVYAMCSYYGISVDTFYHRRYRGMSLRDALERPTSGISHFAKECKDHKGNVYDSRGMMCRYYNISYSCFNSRINAGWSLKDALETPLHGFNRKCQDHRGTEFESEHAMCDYYGINIGTYRGRIKKGWDLQAALETGVSERIVTDHKGNKFRSVKDLCRNYGVSCGTFRYRLKVGWSLKDALETPVEYVSRTDAFRCEDHLGNKFESIGLMCESYGISAETFQARLQRGWSLQDALTIPVKRGKDLIMTKNKVCKLRGSDEEMSSENSYPVFRQKRSGEMCIVWYEKELQLTHEQFLDFLDVVIEVQPITWSWYSKDDFDIDWYGKFYGREQKERLQECLLQRGFEYLPTLGD